MQQLNKKRKNRKNPNQTVFQKEKYYIIKLKLDSFYRIVQCINILLHPKVKLTIHPIEYIFYSKYMFHESDDQIFKDNNILILNEMEINKKFGPYYSLEEAIKVVEYDKALTYIL